MTNLSGEEVRAKLDAASRKGRLPGLHLACRDGIFELRDFGAPFESRLVASLHPEPDAALENRSGQSRISFRTEILPLLPTIFGFILAISIWPGIYLVDSMLRQYFSWYDIPTFWWYVPLSLAGSPWALWSALKKSRKAAADEAARLIGVVATELGASCIPSCGAAESV